jgi:hypothetical protein
MSRLSPIKRLLRQLGDDRQGAWPNDIPKDVQIANLSEQVDQAALSPLMMSTTFCASAFTGGRRLWPSDLHCRFDTPDYARPKLHRMGKRQSRRFLHGRRGAQADSPPPNITVTQDGSHYLVPLSDRGDCGLFGRGGPECRGFGK